MKALQMMKVLKYVLNLSVQEWNCSKVQCYGVLYLLLTEHVLLCCTVVCCICYWQNMCCCAALSCCFKYYLLTVIMTRQCLCDKRDERPICKRKLLQLKNTVVCVCVCACVCVCVRVRACMGMHKLTVYSVSSCSVMNLHCTLGT